MAVEHDPEMVSQIEDDDLRITGYKPLTAPSELQENMMASSTSKETIRAGRQQVRRVLRGRDDRLVVIVGPCSVHDPDAAIEYARKLRAEIERHKNDLCILMRCYLEKPRTTVGWKGLWSDPDLDETYKINKGLWMARDLYLQVTNVGVPIASEMLDTISPQYFADLLSCGAIGARTTESQIHRELVSGLSFPVGFKNGTDGNVDVAMDAVRACGSKHHFLGINKDGMASIVITQGNEDTFVILRGGKNKTNFDTESIGAIAEKIRSHKLPPRIVVDCSHGNSQKNYKNQPKVAGCIADQVAAGDDTIVGVMIESNINEGRQDVTAQGKDGLKYGVSITDSCISFETTQQVFETLAGAVRTRRSLAKNKDSQL